jgi:NADP-dependent 3-hydroxy acid dehydrogenase YdfG
MTATPIDLRGAVVAITGAGRGIGRETARAFVGAGSVVALADIDGETVADAARDLGERAHPFTVDVTSRDSFEHFVESVEETLGPIDVLVNNAGVMPAGPFLAEGDATSATTIDVNLWGPIHGMRLVLPGMISRRRGHIVNVASMAGKLRIPGLAVYVASKHAVVGLSSTVRDEVAGTGVTVSAVCPGVVRTELAAGIHIPLSRVIRVEPEDIARAIVGTLERRPREVSVPRWMLAYDAVTAFLPDALESLLRRALGDDRAMRDVDPSVRAAYDERIARQAAEREE